MLIACVASKLSSVYDTIDHSMYTHKEELVLYYTVRIIRARTTNPPIVQRRKKECTSALKYPPAQVFVTNFTIDFDVAIRTEPYTYV